MDNLTPSERSENMRRIRSKDMKPEMAVRQLIHGRGYRYRLHCKDLPGKPDLVFSPRRKVIFVHGCFWHSHSDPKCPIRRIPKSNTGYWTEKLARNIERDKKSQEMLKSLGWKVLILWECQIKDKEKLISKIKKFLD